MSNDGLFITPKTIDRGRRCQNCIHFDNGDKAKQHYDVRRQQDIIAEAKAIVIREGRLPNEVATAHARGQLAGPRRIGADDPAFDHLKRNFVMGDSYLKAGLLGICRKGAVKSDFVHAMYLCDKWTERVRPDGAEKHDPTSAELKGDQ